MGVGLKSGGHDNKRSWNIQKRFGRFRNKIGITETKKFHSLRKNFSTALENSQVPENIAQQLVGHSKKSMTYSLYSQGASDDVLKGAIEKVTYGSVDQLIKEQLRSLL
jgi:integrase